MNRERATNQDDAAYPVEGFESGLTKRELFAAMAMEGFLANGDYIHNRDCGDGVTETQILAQESVECADALIKELNK